MSRSSLPAARGADPPPVPAAAPPAAVPAAPRAPARRRVLPRRRPHSSLVLSELRAVFLRGRTYAMFGVLAGIPVVVAALLARGASFDAGSPAYVAQASSDGFYVSLAVVALAAPALLPVLIAVVAGDSLAGEAAAGTLRRLALVPVGRTRLLLAKLAAVAAFAVAVPLFVVAVSALIAAAFFPVHEVALLSGVSVSYGAALLRLLGVVGYLAVSYLGLAVLGVCFSALIDVPIVAMGVTVGVVVVSRSLDALPQLGTAASWLPTHDWDDYADLLRAPVPLAHFWADLRVQGAYAAVAGTAAWARLSNREIRN